MRTLFAMGKWQDVLDMGAGDNSVDIQVMRLESYLRLSQYDEARGLARRVLDNLTGSKRKVVLLRLMEVAAKNDDIAGFSEYDRNYVTLEKNPPVKVRYWRGRMHFIGKRYAQAAEEFLKIPLKSEYGVRAQYLLATVEMLQGQLQFAINRFAKLKELDALNDDEKEVIRLAALSHAKLLYKLGRYEEAVRAFRRLPQEELSPLEVSWALLRLGDQIVADQARFKNPRVRVTLAGVEYDSAAKLLSKSPRYPKGSDEEFQNRILWAELLQRHEQEGISISIFEDVIQDANEAAHQVPSDNSSWTLSQPEIQELNRTLSLAKAESSEIDALLERMEELRKNKDEAEKSVFKKLDANLKNASSRLEAVNAKLKGLKNEAVVSLKSKWKTHLEAYSDSARAGLFTTRLRANTRLDDEIQDLEQARATDLRRLDEVFESAEGGARQ